jgi:type I restriction enzyme S subunit
VIADEHILTELPRGWVWTEIGQIGEIVAGGTPSTKDESNFGEDIAWLTPADLSGFSGKYIKRGKRNLSEKGIKSSSAVLMPTGSIVFSSRAPIGYVAITANPIATNQGFKNLLPMKGIFNEYVFYYLKGSKPLAEKYASGTTFSELSRGRFALLPIPLSPYAEQKRIVVKIEELFTRLDAGVEALKKVKRELKRYRQAVLKYAFEGKLTADWREKNKDRLEPASKMLERIAKEREKTTKSKSAKVIQIDTANIPELPESWEWKQIKEITSVLGDGLHGTPVYSDAGEYYFINGNNLTNGKIEIKENTKRVTVEEYEKYKKPLNENTIFVSINGTLGNTAFYNNEKVILGKSACYFNVLNEVDKFYVRYCITSQRFINYAHKKATGSTIKNVGLRAMREFEIPSPSTIQEQQLVVSEIERQFSIADEVEQTIEKSLKEADRLRQSILKRAFEGKLVPQDPSGEPAEKLLERIKTERTKLQAKQKSNIRGHQKENVNNKRITKEAENAR